MSEGFVRKERIHASHKASATNMLARINETLESALTIGTPKLTQLEVKFTKKLETLKQVCSAILDLTEKDHLVDQIEQADIF